MVILIYKTCSRMFQSQYSRQQLWVLSSLCFRHFSVSAPCQKESNTEALIRLNRENLQLYGPVLKPRKTQKSGLKVPLDCESEKYQDNKNMKDKTLTKSGKSSEALTKKKKVLVEKVQKETSKKSKRIPLETTNSFVHIPKNAPEPKIGAAMEEGLMLPISWKEDLCDFISQQTLTTLDSNMVSNNSAYKNLLNLLQVRTLPSVTTILNKTLPPTSRVLLQRWKAKMIREMGTVKFQQYVEELKKNGSNFHLYIQKILAEENMEGSDLHSANEGHWKSIRSFLPFVTKVRSLETEVTHRTMFYRGMIDCVANYDNVLCVIDWKTSQKYKPLISNTYDNPLQVAAYISALNSTSLLDVQIKNAVIIIAYPDGSPADAHFMDESLCETYWEEWKLRLIEFWTSFREKK